MRVVATFLLLLFSSLLLAAEPKVQRDIPYAEAGNKLQTLDVYAPAKGKDHPIVVWIHGGGWHSGDKKDVRSKPQAFVDRGFVFVSINYRLWPRVTIKQIAADVAKAIRWTHDHAAEHGGDPNTLFVMGHSAGAQLAALVCTDERYLKAEKLSFALIKGCVPVDGDTYDLPMRMATVHKSGNKKLAERDKQRFGEEKLQKELSSVTYIARGKRIPPFLILHVADHPDTKSQSQRLFKALQQAGVPAKIHAAEGKNHTTLNDALGLPGDKPSQALFEFLGEILKKPLPAPSSGQAPETGPSAAEPPGPATTGRPNIVVVLADDLGWSDLGCYGGEIPTPHLDKLAAQGLRFRQFYNNAVCGPTRASLLTGLHCQRIGHNGTHWNQPTDFRKCVSVGEVLQTAGYRTIMVGKWQERDLPSKRGFDRFFGPMCQAKISYFHEVQQNPFYLDDQRWKFSRDFYLTDALTDHAVRFVEEATASRPKNGPAKPFFLYLAYIAPHWPLHARAKDIAPHRERYRRLGWDQCREQRFQRQRKMGLVPKDWKLSPRPNRVHDWKADKNQDWQAERMAVYAAQVTNIDRGVGRVLAAVRKAGVADNTLVLFLSDNGAAPDGDVHPTKSGFGFGPGKRKDTWRLDGVPIRPGSGPDNLPGPADTFAAYGLAWATVSNTPFRSTKLLAYEGGIRTPLIAHWPKVIRKGGQMTDQAGHVVDIMATCLDVAEAPYPKELKGRTPLPLEGKSLVPIFRGKQRTGHEVLFWNAPQNQAVRVGPWKLVNAGRGKPWELYHLETDATETHNLAGKHPERVRDMAAQWHDWAKRAGL